jgi:MFS family permease
MKPPDILTDDPLKTPRAAAVAGIVFSVLFIISLVLLRTTAPDDLRDAGTWLVRDLKSVAFAIYLFPFTGIAFLWFIGVLRDRMGTREDRFFATVFMGSGFLFLAMLFVAGAIAAGIVMGFGIMPDRQVESGVYTFGRAAVYQLVSVYAMKMAAVFMISTSTVAMRIQIFPRWMAWLGYGLALLMLLSTGYIFFWAPLVFPLWVLLVSMSILLSDLKSSRRRAADSAPQA